MNIFSRHSEKWEEHILAAGNANSTDARRVAIDTLLTIWSERAERYLEARAGLSWQPRFRARGFLQPVVLKTATPQVTKVDSLNELGVRVHFLEVTANRIYRRLNAVAKMQTYGPQLIETWASARRALGGPRLVLRISPCAFRKCCPLPMKSWRYARGCSQRSRVA